MARTRFIDALKYVLHRAGCLHPFRASRIIALAELRSLEERGERLTDAAYVAGPGVFYIEGVKEAVEGDLCLEKRRGDPERGVKGCVALHCPPPPLPVEVRRLLDWAIEEAEVLDDMELNRRVVEHPLFQRLTKD